MEPDLKDLAIFAEVEAAGSFSEAARRLRMPTSTVSRRIAFLEEQLGISLITRSTRQLRLTDFGFEVLHYARRSAELREMVGNMAADHGSRVAGTLRLSAPPSISDSLLAPLIGGFQAQYPEVRVHILVTDRIVDHIAEGVDLAFQVGDRQDPSNTYLTLLSYRHQLVASPAYLAEHHEPKRPADLRAHKLLAFSFWKPQSVWHFRHTNSKRNESHTFEPHLAINEYQGLAAALVAGVGIGELPPIVQPALMTSGRLLEIMKPWRFRIFHLSIVHTESKYVPRMVRLFKEYAAEMTPGLFPRLRI